MSGPAVAITGGVLAAPWGAGPGDLVVRDGVIAAVVAAGAVDARDVDATIDAAGLLVLPAAIDPHVHLGEPGQEHRETFAAGTAAAALGGVGCVVEHPLSDPPTTTARLYAEKLAIAAAGAHVDHALWGAITPGAVDEIAGQWALGARGFKAFVCDSSGPFPHVDDDTLAEGMRRVAALGGLVLVHCEDDALVRGAAARVRAAGGRDGAAHAAARPTLAEVAAVERVLRLAAETGVRVQIVHLSVPAAAALVDDAVADGRPASLEHTAHHLLLDDDVATALGPWARCAPPLRPRSMVDALWARLLAGGPAQLGSDHSPYARAEKLCGTDDVWRAGMGIRSVQESVPLVLDEALHRRGLPLDACARLVATNAARALGLAPRKGALEVGADADVALWHPDDPWTVDAARQQPGPEPWSPYDGRTCRVRLRRLLVRGEDVVVDGALVARPGSGRPVVPASPAVPRAA